MPDFFEDFLRSKGTGRATEKIYNKISGYLDLKDKDNLEIAFDPEFWLKKKSKMIKEKYGIYVNDMVNANLAMEALKEFEELIANIDFQFITENDDTDQSSDDEMDQSYCEEFDKNISISYLAGDQQRVLITIPTSPFHDVELDEKTEKERLEENIKSVAQFIHKLDILKESLISLEKKEENWTKLYLSKLFLYRYRLKLAYKEISHQLFYNFNKKRDETEDEKIANMNKEINNHIKTSLKYLLQTITNYNDDSRIKTDLYNENLAEFLILFQLEFVRYMEVIGFSTVGYEQGATDKYPWRTISTLCANVANQLNMLYGVSVNIGHEKYNENENIVDGIPWAIEFLEKNLLKSSDNLEMCNRFFVWLFNHVKDFHVNSLSMLKKFQSWALENIFTSIKNMKELIQVCSKEHPSDLFDKLIYWLNKKYEEREEIIKKQEDSIMKTDEILKDMNNFIEDLGKKINFLLSDPIIKTLPADHLQAIQFSFKAINIKLVQSQYATILNFTFFCNTLSENFDAFSKTLLKIYEELYSKGNDKAQERLSLIYGYGFLLIPKDEKLLQQRLSERIISKLEFK